MKKKATKKAVRKMATPPKWEPALEPDPLVVNPPPVIETPNDWVPAQTPTLLTKAQWDNRPNLKRELQTIMQSPVVQIALNLVRQKRSQEVTSPNYSRTGSDLVAFDSASHNETKGWFRCLEYWESLYTARPHVENAPEPEAFDDDYAARILKEKESQNL